MNGDVSPAIIPASPTFNYHGQAIARGQDTLPHALSHAAMINSNPDLESLEISGDFLAMLPRRSTIPWPGQSLTDDSIGLCPACNTVGRQMWNGLNVAVADLPFRRAGGIAIPVYGKTPESYEHNYGEVSFHTLVLWSCGYCQDWWYHYLFHEKTRDGRSQSPPLQKRPVSEDAFEDVCESKPLGKTQSTPGRSSGGGPLQQHWSPTATLVGEPSPDTRANTRSMASRQALLSVSTSTPATSYAQVLKGTPFRPTPIGPTSAPPSTSGRPVPRHTLSNSDPTTQRGHRNLTVDTNSNNVWSQYASRTMNPHQPGFPAPAFSHSHSPSGPSPVAPTPTPTRTGDSIFPIHRAPTGPLAPPAKKVNREAKSYNEMRKMLACEDCRRRKKKCDPSHIAPRVPWAQRPRGGSNDASTIGEGSPTYSPDLAQGESDWMGYGFGQDMSPISAAVSQSPETLGMYAPPQS